MAIIIGSITGGLVVLVVMAIVKIITVIIRNNYGVYTWQYDTCTTCT